MTYTDNGSNDMDETKNTSQALSVSAEITIERLGADGQSAPALTFRVAGTRCGAMSDLGDYLKDRVDDAVANLSPGAGALRRLRRENDELQRRLASVEGTNQGAAEGVPTQRPNTSAPIPRARPRQKD